MEFLVSCTALLSRYIFGFFNGKVKSLVKFVGCSGVIISFAEFHDEKESVPERVSNQNVHFFLTPRQGKVKKCENICALIMVKCA